MKIKLLAFSLMALIGCTDAIPEFKDLNESLKSNTQFSVFSEILKTQNLEKLVQGSGLTILAPTNEALEAIEYKKIDAKDLEDLVKNHIVDRDLDNEQFLSGAVQTLGTKVYFSKDWDGNYTVNGNVKVKGTRIYATNGTVMGIDKVLQKPKFNTLEAIKSQNALSEFLNLADVADPVVNQSLEKLSETGFTLFVPTNEAFTEFYLKYPKESIIKNKSALTKLLMGHILERRIFTSDFSTNWGAFSTLNDESKLLFISAGPKIKGNSNSSKILVDNVLTSNGVLHSIDSVMIP